MLLDHTREKSPPPEDPMVNIMITSKKEDLSKKPTILDTPTDRDHANISLFISNILPAHLSSQ